MGFIVIILFKYIPTSRQLEKLQITVNIFRITNSAKQPILQQTTPLANDMPYPCQRTSALLAKTLDFVFPKPSARTIHNQKKLHNGTDLRTTLLTSDDTTRTACQTFFANRLSPKYILTKKNNTQIHTNSTIKKTNPLSTSFRNHIASTKFGGNKNMYKKVICVFMWVKHTYTIYTSSYIICDVTKPICAKSMFAGSACV